MASETEELRFTFYLLFKKIVFTFNYFKLLVASGYHIGNHNVELSGSRMCSRLTASYCFLGLVHCSYHQKMLRLCLPKWNLNAESAIPNFCFYTLSA